MYSTLEAHFQRDFFSAVKFSPDFQTIGGDWYDCKHTFKKFSLRLGNYISLISFKLSSFSCPGLTKSIC